MKGFFIGSLVVVLAAGLPALAQQTPNVAERIAPLVSKRTIAVAYVNLSRLNMAELREQLRGRRSATDRQWKVADKSFREIQNYLASYRVREFYIVRNISNAKHNRILLAIPITDKMDIDKLKALCRTKFNLPEARQMGKLLIAGGNSVRWLGKEKHAKNSYLAPAFAAVAGEDVQAVVAPGETARTFLDAVFLPLSPVEPGGGKEEDLTKVCQWIAAGVQFKPHLSGKLILQGRDARRARMLHAMLNERLSFLKTRADVGRPVYAKLAELVQPRVVGNRVVARMKKKDMLALLWTVLIKLPDMEKQFTNITNLKEIGAALHKYEQKHRAFPAAASHSAKGRPLLSWRVHILPFLGRQDLYKQFKLDEPWNSPHNKKLIPQMPAIFRSPFSHAESGRTTYLAPAARGAVLGKRPVSLVQISTHDWATFTIVVVEAADDRAVIWTRPRDLPINPRRPVRDLAHHPPGSFTALFATGEVHSLPRTTSTQTINALFNWHDGKTVELP